MAKSIYDIKLSEKLEAIRDNYINGNKEDFRKELAKLKPYEVARLIAKWQPYHSAITAICRQYQEGLIPL
jgi:hypothetical protein